MKCVLSLMILTLLGVGTVSLWFAQGVRRPEPSESEDARGVLTTQLAPSNNRDTAPPAVPFARLVGRLAVPKEGLGENVRGSHAEQSSASNPVLSGPIPDVWSSVPNPSTESIPPPTVFSRATDSSRRNGKEFREASDDSASSGFRVPLPFADGPLPAYVVLSGSSAKLPSLPPHEQEVLRRAEELFFSGLEAAPTQDETRPEYADYWNASRQRSDDYLRAMLGWQRFNTLSFQALKAYQERFEATQPGLADRMPSETH